MSQLCNGFAGMINCHSIYLIDSNPPLKIGLSRCLLLSFISLIFPGAVIGELLDDIVPIFVANLGPNKEPEVCLKVFSLLSKLVLNAPSSVDSAGKFNDFCVVVVREMILPNLVWKAGRVASAIRTTAVSCLWALLKSSMLNKEKVSQLHVNTNM